MLDQTLLLSFLSLFINPTHESFLRLVRGDVTSGIMMISYQRALFISPK